MEAARHSSILATTTYEQTNTTSEANKFAALNINLPDERRVKSTTPPCNGDTSTEFTGSSSISTKPSVVTLTQDAIDKCVSTVGNVECTL